MDIILQQNLIKMSSFKSVTVIKAPSEDVRLIYTSILSCFVNNLNIEYIQYIYIWKMCQYIKLIGCNRALSILFKYTTDWYKRKGVTPYLTVLLCLIYLPEKTPLRKLHAVLFRWKTQSAHAGNGTGVKNSQIKYRLFFSKLTQSLLFGLDDAFKFPQFLVVHWK